MKHILDPKQYRKYNLVKETLGDPTYGENYRILSQLQSENNLSLYEKLGSIKYGKIPNWLKPALLDHGYSDSSVLTYTKKGYLTMPSLFDHFGKIKGAKEMFFAHPYEEKVNKEDFEWLLNWTKKNNFEFKVLSSSFYFPSRTLMILVYKLT